MSEDVKLEPHEAVFSAIARHVTVTPQDGRFLITVGHGLIDDPVYELYNTEQSANDTAHDLVSVLSVVIGDIMTQREQAAYERGKTEERARVLAIVEEIERNASINYDVAVEYDKSNTVRSRWSTIAANCNTIRKAINKK